MVFSRVKSFFNYWAELFYGTTRGSSRITRTKNQRCKTVKVTRFGTCCWLWVDLFHEQAVKSDIKNNTDNKAFVKWLTMTIHLLNGLRIKRDPLIVVIS